MSFLPAMAMMLAALTGMPAQQIAPPASAASQAAPVGGVVTDACARAPSQEQLGGWIPWHTWLYANDFGQLCYYQHADRQLQRKPQAARRVIFIGDSITEVWEHKDAGFFVDGRVGRGVSGQTTAQMLVRFRQDVIEMHPRVVHIMGGINDIAGNTGVTTLRAIEGNIADMAELARAHGIKVVLGSMLPTTAIPWQPGIKPSEAIDTLDHWLARYAHQHGFVYADYYHAMKNASGGMKAGLSSDGVHPTVKGFAVMDAIARKALARALAGADRD